jgi:superfamily II DNA or RNA helicase
MPGTAMGDDRDGQVGTEAEAGVRLEDLTPGARVRGVVPGSAVEVRAVQWHGTQAVTLTYRTDDGTTGERLVFRGDEPGLVIESEGRARAFDADGQLFRLAAEARRIRLAHLFDPMLAVHLSAVEPLPHQIRAVYGEMLHRQPLRFLLADDPGAGKTIMAGLLIRELHLRGVLRRGLVVAPGGLVAQWQDELADKFGLSFRILTNEMVEASRTGNPFLEHDLLIARLDHLARNDGLQAKLADAEWDLVVVDEAHRMAAHWYGNEIVETKRYRLGRLLRDLTTHLLLMTATPHNGKEEDFQLFMALLDPDRFEGRFRDGVHRVSVDDLMRRALKEELLRFDGRPLFPRRVASTVPYPLTELESRLYREVTDYVVEEMNRADRLRAEGEGRRGNRVGFALTVLQRRLASSPEAIFQSLRRRRERLQARLVEERGRRTGRSAAAPSAVGGGPGVPPDRRALALLDDLERDDDPEAFDDLSDAELEALEEELVDEATAARTVAELESELATLRRLEALARQVRSSGEDRKWRELASLLEDEPALRHPDGSRRKLIVFTEHRDTMSYLAERLRSHIGRVEAVVTIHGGTRREERRRIQEVFTQDPDTLVLVATDAAGEGVNLQRAHLLVNYDLPWNPNRIEQRFGRVHRIGQTEVCHMWNLVAEDTREGQVYLRLLEKLQTQSERLGGRVFDVLGEAFRGVPLRELLLRAVRFGDDPEVRADLDRVIDARVGEGLAELVEREALAHEVMSLAEVERVRADLEEAAARRLQPRYVRAFFLDALRRLGGRAVEREPGRWELTHVPLELRRRSDAGGGGAPVLERYERICFERERERVPGAPLAEFVCPGHPLLDAAIAVVSERHGSLLARGTTLVDDRDPGTEPRLLVFLEHAVVDGRRDRRGDPTVVSRRFEFLELRGDGEPRPAGPAPYLDLRPPDGTEASLLTGRVAPPWLADDVTGRVIDAAVETVVPEHLAQVRARTTARVAKVRAAVRDRLKREITYWDTRATELRFGGDDRRGRSAADPANAERAARRAAELQRRLEAREAELDAETQLAPLPPHVAGAALVVPAGLLANLRGAPADEVAAHASETARVERLAVDAVLAAERALGREPEEMSHANPGFDIRSRTREGRVLFIEVKGRVAGAPDFAVTRNEILFALNAGDAHVLALVEVGDAGATEVRYLRRAFAEKDGGIHFAETSTRFNWAKMWALAGPPS